MPDEHSQKIIQLLEEIRDLTKLRNEKLAAMIQDNRKQAEEFQRRVLAKRRQYLLILAPLLLLAIGVLIYIAFWAIPESDAKQTQEQIQEYQMIQSNDVAEPH